MSSACNQQMKTTQAGHLKQNWVLATGFMIVVPGLMVFFYNLGGRQATTSNAGLLLENRALQESIDAMDVERNQYLQGMSVVKMARAIDKQAIENTRTTIRQLEAEKSQLTQELAFYRSIMVPEAGETGVRVQTIELHPTAKQHTFRFRIVIAQVSRVNALLKGNLSITIEGLDHGEKTDLSLFQLAGIAQNSVSLGFRYFQTLPEKPDLYLVTLPEGFIPKTIRVAIRIRSGSGQQLNKTYEWANLLEKSGSNLWKARKPPTETGERM